MKTTVLGAGSWGTALALHFSQYGNEVALQSRSTAYIKKLQAGRGNKKGLPGFTFPGTLHVHTDLGEALRGSELAVIATSVAGLRDSATLLKQNDATHLPVLTVCKSFGQDTGLLTFQVVKNVLSGNGRIGVFSGPSFIQELAQQLSCAVILASENKEQIEELIPQLSTGVMRLYGSSDVVGVTAGGAVKNIIAIATGLSDGLEYGLNTRAALATRGLAKITRLAVAIGTRPKTPVGLAGVGDLILTYTGALSRSRRVDLGLAEGKELHRALMEIGHTSEGINTIEEVFNTTAKYQIDISITQTLLQLIRKEMTLQQVVEKLIEHDMHFEQNNTKDPPQTVRPSENAAQQLSNGLSLTMGRHPTIPTTNLDLSES